LFSFFKYSRYDEGKCLYSIKNLTQHPFPIIYTLPSGNGPPDKFRLRILKLAGQWSTATIYDYLHAPDANVSFSAIRILETLLKQALLPLTNCEGSLFYRDEIQPNVALPDGFELRLGFFQALYLTQAGLTLNLQTTLTKFYPYMDIIDFLQINLNKDIRKHGMTSNDYEKARVVLSGCKITTKQSNYTQVEDSFIHFFYLFYFWFLRFIKFEVFLIFPNDRHLILQEKRLSTEKKYVQ
jgi:hypothetical protein